MSVAAYASRRWWLLLTMLTLVLLGCLALGTSAAAWPAPANTASLVSPATTPYTTCSTLSFAPPVLYPVGTRPRSASMGDFNRDSYLDLVVTDYSSRTVSVLIGNGDGTFQQSVNYPVGF